MTYRMVHVGLGGQGETWLTEAIPPNVDAGRVEVVAAVDTDPEKHELAETPIDTLGQWCQSLTKTS